LSETRTRILNWFVSGGVARTHDGGEFTIDVDAVVVGRDPGAAIVLSDPEVSALHCELRAVSEGILVKDLGSTNGTFLGAIRVREATVTTPIELTVGRSKVLLEPQAKHRVDVGFADRFGPLVGASPKMRRVFGVLEKVAATPLSVLIMGETGTGKELAARAIHDASDRKGGPLVIVDCGSIPPTLAESILFGHEKGAFTGAADRRKGALAEADGGTLFLDELGELPIELQPKLLRALSEKQVKRVGASSFEPIDVRVLAATRRDLGEEMNAGRFRSDLFFRIAQVRVELPPLRERMADLPLLVEDVCHKVQRSQHAQAGQCARAEQRGECGGDIGRRSGGHRRRADSRSRRAVAGRLAIGSQRIQRGQTRGDWRVRARLLQCAGTTLQGQCQRDGAPERYGAPSCPRLPSQVRHREVDKPRLAVAFAMG